MVAYSKDTTDCPILYAKLNSTNISVLDVPISEFIISQCSYPKYAKQIVDFLQGGYDEAKARAENAKKEYLRITKEIGKLKENLAYTKTQEQVDMIFHMIEERQQELKHLSEVESYPVGKVVNAVSINKVSGLLTNIKSIWKNQPNNVKNEFLRIVLDKIIVYPDNEKMRVEIIWKTGVVQRIEIDRPVVPSKAENKWTDEETKIVKEHFPTATWEELGTMLPNRNYDAIMARAEILGVKRNIRGPRDRNWSLEEDKVLKEHGAKNNADVVQLARMLKRGALPVFRRMKHLGAYRNKFTGFRGATMVTWRVTFVGDTNKEQSSGTVADR